MKKGQQLLYNTDHTQIGHVAPDQAPLALVQAAEEETFTVALGNVAAGDRVGDVHRGVEQSLTIVSPGQAPVMVFADDVAVSGVVRSEDEWRVVVRGAGKRQGRENQNVDWPWPFFHACL